MVEIWRVNRITGENVRMALYCEETRIAHIQFAHDMHRMWSNDTYNIQDDVMHDLAARGCEVVQILEINHPENENTRYNVPFADWYGQAPVDYGFGSGLQYPMASDSVRRTPTP